MIEYRLEMFSNMENRKKVFTSFNDVIFAYDALDADFKLNIDRVLKYNGNNLEDVFVLNEDNWVKKE